MKIILSQKYKNNKKELALKLLEWHGGQWSGLYSVGSMWLAGRELTDNEPIQRAIRELEDIAQKKVNYPETITDENIAEVRNLQNLLKQEIIHKENSDHYTPDTLMGLNDDNPVPGFDY
jgi:hypothetical protein